VNLKDVIRADKKDVDLGKWAPGHIPRSAFPMSKLKDKRYKYGPEWKWRVVKFEALGRRCRVLIFLNENKEILRARLGVDVNGDMVVLCDHEFHAAEPGWHCHLTLEEVEHVPSGAARGGKVKWPRSPSRQDFGVDDASALTVVAECFNINAQGELL